MQAELETLITKLNDAIIENQAQIFVCTENIKALVNQRNALTEALRLAKKDEMKPIEQ